MTDWQTYYNQHLSRPPRPIIIKAVCFCTSKDTALDLGAGTLVESKFLLDSGFNKVVAVDSSPGIKKFAESINDDRLVTLVNPFRDLVLSPDEFDLISAQYVLPFYGPKGFDDFIVELVSSLKAGGVFVGQFFGERDGWNTPDSKLTFQTKEEAMILLKNLKVEEFIEEEKDETTAAGEAKHWHVFHFIATKSL